MLAKSGKVMRDFIITTRLRSANKFPLIFAKYEL